MSLLPRGIPWRSLRRRFAHAGFLLCYLAVALGMPMPAPARKDVSQPFPCQDNPCGCQSAEQCWTSCCCYTVEEHWAWARDHNVEPPPYATRPADGEWNVKPQRDQEACQSAHDGCSCQSKPSQAEKPKPAKWRWASGLASLRCRGASIFGPPGGVSTPPPLLTTWKAELTAVDTLCHTDLRPLTIAIRPPDPPPRNSSI
jgi:hypothetical protein